MKLLKFPHYILLLILFYSCKSPAVLTDLPEQEPLVLSETPEEDSIPEMELPIKSYPKKEFAYQGSRERKFDLLHTSLDLRFDYERQWVLGRALLDIKPYFYPQEQLELDAKDFDIHDVWLQDGQENRPLAFSYNQRIATIHLPGTYTSQDTLKIGISYTAKTLENSGKGSAAITDNKGLYFINPEKKEGKPVQIWTQGETEHNSKWFPTIDSPNERATHDIRLTVEEKYMTISNGVLASQENHADGTRTDHWKMDLPHAPYLTALVIGEFSVIEDSVDNLPLRYLVEEKYVQGAREVFKNTPAMITYFSALLGVDFPWQKYDQIVVRDFVSGAMENTTASIFMEELNRDQREAKDSEWDYIIAHELFHQWFGNYVTTESWSNLPLNESFADYAEYLWMEHQEGKDPADMHHIIGKENYLSEAGEKQVDLIRFQYENPEDMFDNHSYAKGGRVLHMLRNYLGDEAFFSSLHHYLEKNAFSTVEIHDLRLAFEAVTGRDLNWFFNQWFLSSGHPILDVTFDMSQPENILLTVTQEQDLSLNTLYKLPFEVSWYHDGQRTARKFFLDQTRQQFALENGVETDLVIFDESQILLAEKKIRNGRETLENQAVLSHAGIARYAALDSLANQHRYDSEMEKLFEGALYDKFSSVRELALAKIALHFDSIPLSPGGEDQVYQIAMDDPENTVRAGAIELLDKISSEKYASLFLDLVNDSSYYVAGAALTAYMDQDNNPHKDSLVKEMLNADNIRILVPLAEHFTKEADSDQTEWFQEKLENLAGESLYYFIGYYGDYFARLEEVDISVPVESLYKIALADSNGFIRLVAFQALFGFIDEEGVLEKVKFLHEAEKDPKNKEYQGFFLESYVE